ncbi:MAG: ester cyclase [Litoreibacter sp.]|nr:ester cyclase [Litoreibacter sp.]MCY4336805.1 ester cyclase [Litoreibacter sp.]
MEGFDAKWRDVPHYINGITHDIWEARRIGSLKQYYGEGLIVRSPASIVEGNDGIIAATMATLAEFPDRALLGEDVIWCPAPGGFLSSHRLICTAAHLGDGAYGPATGRALEYRILADCYCTQGAVVDEWLVRDQSAIVEQMGFDLVDWTRAQIAREGGPGACVKPFTPARDIQGPYRGTGNDHAHGAALAEVLTRAMSADFSFFSKRYDRAASLHYPGHVTSNGPSGADRFWLPLRSAFPSATFKIHHAIGRDDAILPPRAAVRWSLNGKHDGHGRFGTPTGAEVHVMGITHAEFGPWGLRREWTLIDDTAIWRQILLATGDF